MDLQQFKMNVDQCIRDARAQGLSDEQILLEMLEQVRNLTCKQILRLAALEKRG